MSRKYTKGARKEYELANYLWEEGWAVTRQASSGGVGHAAADVTAVKDGKIWIFEVKGYESGKGPWDVSSDSEQLCELATRVVPDDETLGDLDDIEVGFAVQFGDIGWWYVYPDTTTWIKEGKRDEMDRIYDLLE